MRNIKSLIIVITSLFLVNITSSAMPAKKGVWKLIKLKSGEEVNAELIGDETFHYFRDANGKMYVQKSKHTYILKTEKQIKSLQKKAYKKKKQNLKHKRQAEKHEKRMNKHKKKMNKHKDSIES